MFDIYLFLLIDIIQFGVRVTTVTTIHPLTFMQTRKSQASRITNPRRTQVAHHAIATKKQRYPR